MYTERENERERERNRNLYSAHLYRQAIHMPHNWTMYLLTLKERKKRTQTSNLNEGRPHGNYLI